MLLNRLFGKKTKKYPEFEAFKNTSHRTMTRSWFVKYYENETIDDNKIFYESFLGSGLTDNPYAFFRYLLEKPEYSKLQHVWAVKNVDSPLAKRFGELPNVKIVESDSEEYIKELCTSKYLISNNTFLEYFIKKEEQVYVNTWHGTPIKTLGKDIKGSLGQHRNLQRNLLHCDFFVNPNKYTADIMLRSCEVDQLYQGYVADIGYPRSDWLFSVDKQRLKRKLNLPLEGKKIILYAPTWRGEVGGIYDMSQDVLERVSDLQKKLPDDCILLLKLHHMMDRYLTDEMRRVSIPEDVEINQVLAITDILITDYSSVFFDFMITKKPILFYTYDLESYENNRGLYVDMKEMPGPLCKTTSDLIYAIKNLDKIEKNYRKAYESYLEQYSYNDDGHACERLAKLIFENQKDEEKVYKPFKCNDKEKILFYAGTFINNGVTNSFINLSQNVDYTKYDIYLILDSFDEKKRFNIERIHPKVKILYKLGDYGFLPEEYDPYIRLMEKGIKKKGCLYKDIPKNVFIRERKRLFGSLKFDHVIDYSGYTMRWICFMAFGGFKESIIYQHSDMKAEMNRKVNGQKPLEASLKAIFTVYDYCDKLVSVSKSVESANKKSLAELTSNSSDKTYVVENTLDTHNIQSQAQNGFVYERNNKRFYSENYNISEGQFIFEGTELPDKKNINFICIGRMSLEKDHKKLIHAFKKVYEKYQNTRLFLVGDGPLRVDTENEIKRLGLEEKIILTGHLNNPFYLLNQSDCFVLSSNHEGQGLVLLEAMVLGKYCISTDIDGPRSLIHLGNGALVDNSADGLANAMISYVEENKIVKKFDYQKYNNDALDAFYYMIRS